MRIHPHSTREDQTWPREWVTREYRIPSSTRTHSQVKVWSSPSQMVLICRPCTVSAG